MTATLRLSALRERLRSSLWFLPAVSVTASLILAFLLSSPRLETELDMPGVTFVGTPEGARAILSTVAGSMITVTGLTFSLTVVALQVASSQFTPRLLGSFLADRGNQTVLSVFLSTFVYSLVVLRSVRSGTEGTDPFVPTVAVALGLLLTLLSAAMLVYFFHHLTQQLRVETVLADLRRDILGVVDSYLPDEDEVPAGELPDVPDDAVTIRAQRSGYLHMVQVEALQRVAEQHEVVIRLRAAVGVHLSRGTTIAWVWSLDGGTVDGEDLSDELTSGIHTGIHIASERTLKQDAAFGVRQLVDVAARALSTGVNDPTTAVAAIGVLADVLTELTDRRLGPRTAHDDDGRVRVAVPQPTFPEILALACDQPRRYGRNEPAVLRALLTMLADIAEVAPDHIDADAVEEQIEITVETAGAADLAPGERRQVEAVARHARAALRHRGRVADVSDDVEQPAT